MRIFVHSLMFPALWLLMLLIAPAATTIQVLVVSTVEQDGFIYDAGSVPLVSDNALTESEATSLPITAIGNFAKLVAAKSSSTALSIFRYTTEGETFFHYGYAEHAAGFESGLRPGGSATTLSDLTGAEAKSGLALPHAAPPNAVYTITPKPGTLIRVNPVAEDLFNQPGGLPEIQFPMGTEPGTVSAPTLIR